MVNYNLKVMSKLEGNDHFAVTGIVLEDITGKTLFKDSNIAFYRAPETFTQNSADMYSTLLALATLTYFPELQGSSVAFFSDNDLVTRVLNRECTLQNDDLIFFNCYIEEVLERLVKLNIKLTYHRLHRMSAPLGCVFNIVKDAYQAYVEEEGNPGAFVPTNFASSTDNMRRFRGALR